VANLDSFLGGLKAGNDIAEMGRSQRNRAMIGNLAPSIIGGDPQAFARAAAVDPAAAKDLQASGEGLMKRTRGAAQYLESALKSGNEAQIAAARRSVKPFMDTLQPGASYPMDMDPQQELAGIQSFLAQTAHLDPTLSKGTPTDVRSFQLMTQGLSPEDQERARRINLGLDGRASSSGFSQVKFTGADGRERIGVLNGKTGQIDLPDGTSFNPQTGAISQTQSDQPETPQVESQHFGNFTSLAGEFPGVSMTSGMRTAERNQQIGGAANSQHLTGTAADYAVPTQLKPAFMSRARQLGYQAIDEGDHIHLQLPRGASKSAGSGAFVGRSPEEQAALTEQAKANVQLANLPAELQMRTQAEIAKTSGVEQAKSEQERASNERAKTAQLNNVDRGLSRIDSALKGLTGKFVDTGPIDGRLMIATPEGQELEAAVGAIQNDMLALTRVPGIGSQSDLEAKIANLKYPSIYNHPSVNAANVQQLRAFMTDLRRQITGQGGSQQAQNAGRTVVRTGTSNGRKVIQYSDGSIEYGN